MKILPFDGLTLSENQLKVLKLLAEYHSADANCLFFSYISKETGIETRLVRLACRAMARKGLTEFVRGLFDEEGMAAGSGYCCTSLGRDVIDRMQELEQVKKDWGDHGLLAVTK